MSKRYVFNRDLNIYEQVQADRFAYSDGDAVENFLYKTIKNAGDVSTGSDELIQYISDWATLYHLSPARANLLRPIEQNLRGKQVLELGSGCGAISRFLGETGCELTCVEGSHRRAAITAARCRGLSNVKVYNDNFQDFQAEHQFDVVTLIGVLEYSRKFIKGEDPIAAALALAQSFLKPDGVLIIAIENKLGLKYWAGALEDHVGVPFYGIESLYGEATAVTFGKKEIARVLQRANFGDLEFYYPYPDYKLPGMVLSELVEDADPAIANNLLSASFAPNQVVDYARVLSEGATYRALVDNGLVGDLANSFLIIAKKGQGNWQNNRSDLAFTYSLGRRRDFGKEVHIREGEQGTVVRRRLLFAKQIPAGMQFATEEPLQPGETLFNSLLPIVNREGWTVEHLVNWMQPLYRLLFKDSSLSNGRRVVPGRFLDASAFNMIEGAGDGTFFDLEWNPWPEVDLNYVLFRGLYQSLARTNNVAQPHKSTTLALTDLTAQVVERLSGTAVEVDRYLMQEVEFLNKVSLNRFSVDGFKASQLRVRVQPTRMRHALAESQKALANAPAARTDAEGKLLPAAAPGSNKPFINRWLDTRVPTPIQNRLIGEYVAGNNGGPSLGILVLDLVGDSTKLMTTIKSLGMDKNLYATLKIVVLSVSSGPATTLADKLHFIKIDKDNYIDSLNQVAASADFDWLMLAEAGVEFTASGLMMVALELIAAPDCRAVYGDELQRMPDGALGATMRPAFNLDLLLSFPTGMARHWLVRRDVFLEVGGFRAEYRDALELDLLLRLIEQGGLAGLGHVDETLLIGDAPTLRDNPTERTVIERHLATRGYQAKIVPGLPGRYHVNYGHPGQPLVSIIIPSKDQLPLLQRCVESLLEKTAYANYEVLIVDNASVTPEAREWLAGIAAMGEDKIRVLRYPHPFNFSAINNMAAKEARGEYLVLLNNDTAIVREDWLDELLNHAQRPEVGVVGGKLLYPDGRIESAGLLLGLRGPAESPFVGESMDAAGYMQRLQVDQNYSAVSAACMMVRKSVYLEAGGMDEDTLKLSFNDVDLCLNIRQLGYLTVWTPHAVVMHEGGASIDKLDPVEPEVKQKRLVAAQDTMYSRWLPLLARDPAHNANFSLNDKGFDLEPDLNLTWRPLTWRPLPVVLAHPADPFGCGNYRMIRPFKAQKEAGLIDGMLSSGLLHVVDLERYNPDVVVLQRQISDGRLEAMRRIKQFSNAFKVYELDDYLPNLPMKSVHRDQMPKDVLRSLRKGLGFVDRFVVSTAPLAEAFSGLHDDIRVMENRLPVEWWKGLTSQRRRGRKPRVGWAGGVSHTGDLELIADVVKELANEVEWVFFGMCPEKIRPYVHEVHTGVDIDLYPAALAKLDLDLALAPVEQNLFNECKSNLRLLEYGACGFPVVCSDLVCYQGDLPVTRVKNRFKDWVDAIRAHISDLDATARMGDELRAQVNRDWMLEGANAEAWCKAWLPD
ncbi:MAG: glycosyltransferase [Pseudomonas sp.]|uniref:glycosyltransferase n=1 Tax=Pseudomonas sp. TaxID=306 RepID=UPI003D0ACA34